MTDLSIGEMQAMQRRLQDRYKDQWTPLTPAQGRSQLLWMIGEIGEVIDVIKHNGDQCAAAEPALRSHLVEELADVLMYYNDVLLCYGITPEELRRSYVAKFERNMTRW